MKMTEIFEAEGNEKLLEQIKNDMKSFLNKLSKKEYVRHPRITIKTGYTDRDGVELRGTGIGSWEVADDEAYRDDKEIWDKESYEFYVNLFEEWAKGYNWYEQVNLEIDTGYKNSAYFWITLKPLTQPKRKSMDWISYAGWGAESFDVEFNEWADQEMNSHGKNISFKDWADDEGLKHGNTEITDWAEHEDESHDARYGAEELKKDSCCCGATKTHPCACMIQGIETCSATCPCSLEKKGAETYEDSWEKGVIRLAISSGCFNDEYAEWVERQIDGPNATLNNPRYKEIIDKRWGLNAENWGGDPEGKLALALQKARDKAKEPRKPLKIEKLDAENYRYVKPVPISHSGGGHKWNGYYAIKGYEEPTADGFTYRILSSPGTKDWYRVYVYDTEKMFQNKSRRLNPSGKMVGSSNPASHLIGSFPRLDDAKRALVFRMIQDEQYHHILSDGNLNWLLHGKNPGSRKWKAEKGIDTFTKPFEESSLDSGTVKSVLVGLGIGALALFGYNKWK